MSYHSHRMLPPGASRKRKEKESYFPIKPSIKPSSLAAHLPPSPRADKPAVSNKLLAGYMAYEFLTRGTLFGEKFDPARAEAVPVTEAKKKVKAEAEPPSKQVASNSEANKRYAELAGILKTNGAHIPGIVNPTELARWLQR